MSVYISMEMPTSCKRCEFFTPFQNGLVMIGPLGHCDRLGKEVFYLEQRREDCPLIPVPPHGRLIDADALEKLSLPMTEIIDGEIVQNRYVSLGTIRQMPTIIPADKGGDV